MADNPWEPIEWPFHYKPHWQGPLSGRSFEKQTEDALNAIIGRIDGITGSATPSDAMPQALGAASPGVSNSYSRGDHIHPKQTTITGNAATATKLKNARNITISGDASGSSTFDGSENCTIPVSITGALITPTGATVGRTLPEHFADVINVRDFGAVGDGTADDSDAIQAALDLCEGKTVWFPQGRYLISRTMRVEHGRCRIQGTQAVITSGGYDETGTIFGLHCVGVSDVLISGMYFEGVRRGIDVWLSEYTADYPATYQNCVTDIRIENCVFDTRKWAISFVGVYGATISNITLNQYRTASYSNRDGIHLHGCVNILIDDVMGTTDDDFVAIFPSEKFINPDERTYYGICDKIFISNCVVDNSKGETSDDGARSFLALDGCDTSYLSTNNRFSIDNVVISDCSIITDTGCALRMSGYAVPTYIGSVKFFDCYISRAFVSNRIINAQNSTTMLVRSSIDELVFDRCKFDIDPRWTKDTFVVSTFGIFRNVRRMALNDCQFRLVGHAISFDDLQVSGGLDNIESVEITGCAFTSSNSDRNIIPVRLLRRNVDKFIFRDISTGTSDVISNYIRIDRCSIGEMVFEGIKETSLYSGIEIESSTAGIGKLYLSRVTFARRLIGNEQTSTAWINVVGDFTNDISPAVFVYNTDYIRAHGIDLLSDLYAPQSYPGSVARIPQNGVLVLAVMGSGNQWIPYQRQDNIITTAQIDALFE